MRGIKKIIGNKPKREAYLLYGNIYTFKERIINWVQDLHEQVVNCMDAITNADIKDGKDGKDGANGVGIKNISVIESSQESEGANKIRITLSNDRFYDFVIYNGQTGPQGDNGQDGQDGKDGADALINGLNTLFIEPGSNIKITQSGNTLTIQAVVPTKTSDLNNDSGFLTQHQSLNGYVKYYLCQDEDEYNSIQSKENDTLYLIPKS